MAPIGIEASAPVVTGIGLQLTFIHIFSAELACPLRRTLAVVGVDPIYTGASIHAHVIWTVINVNLTVVSFKARQASALIAEVPCLATSAPI